MAALVLASALGCGGRSVRTTPSSDAGTSPDDAGTPPDDAGTPPDDAGTPLDDAGTPPPIDAGTPPDDAGTREPSALELFWSVPIPESGDTFDAFAYEAPAFVAISPDNARVALAGNSPTHEFDARDGTLLVAPPQDYVTLARSRGFDRELRHRGGSLELVEVASGDLRWRAPADPWPRVAAFSHDDLYVVALACGEENGVVQRFGVDDGLADPHIVVGACDAFRTSGHTSPSVALLAGGWRALIGGVIAPDEARYRVYDVDFRIRRADALAFGADPYGFVASLASVASGGVAVRTSDGALSWYEAPFTQSPLSMVAPLAYISCYFVPPVIAPVALSVDGRYLATTALDEHSLVLRRTADGVELAHADTVGAFPKFCPYFPGTPVLAAFSPAGNRLAVLWYGWLSLYAVR